jgi:GH15 family glucan-1,4-alpha-glucosidase
MGTEQRYPPIADYALIGDCHAAALVSRRGGIDWCCLPRFDSPSVFARLLDWDGGGTWTVGPSGEAEVTRRYVQRSMVLETTFRTRDGELRLTDAFAMRRGGRTRPRRELLRLAECTAGRIRLEVRLSPRFDYGETSPWIRPAGAGRHTAVGGSTGLEVRDDAGLAPGDDHDLVATTELEVGQARSLSIRFVRPEELDEVEAPRPMRVREHLDETLAWWERWSDQVDGDLPAEALRSAIVLKAMTHAPTGGMIAAPTTSLPEWPGGPRNWDYRHCWVRDSAFAVRSLGEIGFFDEADGFRRFAERSAAGDASELQVLYGVGGERLTPEIELPWLHGYRGATPVRIGNLAARQVQLDIYGELIDLAWQWQLRGRSPDPDYWAFLQTVVDQAVRRWRDPDRGIWEVRSEPQHFVHSKAMCWVALDRGVRIAEAGGLGGPVDGWARERDAVRTAVERDGYDADRGVFVRAFGSTELDAALLLLPEFGFVAYDDERMVRTADAIRDGLTEGGLVRRYRADDGFASEEGAFLACTFWLAECLARQGRTDEARDVFDGAAATRNDLGLFSEELDPATGEMLGNFPQGLTHLSHIQAAAALSGIPLPD